jgi:uncharacterized protein (TIGR04255 family)
LSASVRLGADEWDRPLGGLEGLARVRLERTHLEAAVAEVRFVAGRPAVSEADAAAVWEGLGSETFPIFEPHVQNTVNMTITPQGAVQQHETEQGWVLASADRVTAITLLPARVVVQTRAYDRYNTSLGTPLARVLSLFTQVTGASVIQRLGLRYINRLTDQAATHPQFWCEHVREPYAGPLNGPVGHLVLGQHQQTQLRLDDTAGARIQSGVFQEPGPHPRFSFLADLDVYREQASSYDADVCANQVRQLNRTALALFAMILSEQYLSDLGPVAVSAHDTGGDDSQAVEDHHEPENKETQR